MVPADGALPVPAVGVEAVLAAVVLAVAVVLGEEVSGEDEVLEFPHSLRLLSRSPPVRIIRAGIMFFIPKKNAPVRERRWVNAVY